LVYCTKKNLASLSGQVQRQSRFLRKTRRTLSNERPFFSLKKGQSQLTYVQANLA
jgi:hypothetical protein